MAACSASLLLTACLFDGSGTTKQGSIGGFAVLGDTVIAAQVFTFESSSSDPLDGSADEKNHKESLTLLSSKESGIRAAAAAEIPVEAGPFLPEAFFACSDNKLVALRAPGRAFNVPGLCEIRTTWVSPDGKRVVLFDATARTLYLLDDTLAVLGSARWKQDLEPSVLSLDEAAGKLYLYNPVWDYYLSKAAWYRLAVPSLSLEATDTLEAFAQGVRGEGIRLVCKPGAGKPREVCWEPDANLYQLMKGRYGQWDPARNRLVVKAGAPTPADSQARFEFVTAAGDSAVFDRGGAFRAYVSRQ